VGKHNKTVNPNESRTKTEKKRKQVKIQKTSISIIRLGGIILHKKLTKLLGN